MLQWMGAHLVHSLPAPAPCVCAWQEPPGSFLGKGWGRGRVWEGFWEVPLWQHPLPPHRHWWELLRGRATGWGCRGPRGHPGKFPFGRNQDYTCGAERGYFSLAARQGLGWRDPRDGSAPFQRHRSAVSPQKQALGISQSNGSAAEQGCPGSTAGQVTAWELLSHHVLCLLEKPAYNPAQHSEQCFPHKSVLEIN